MAGAHLPPSLADVPFGSCAAIAVEPEQHRPGNPGGTGQGVHVLTLALTGREETVGSATETASDPARRTGVASARQTFAQLLEIEEPDAAPLLLDHILVGQVVKRARDGLPAQRECGGEFLLC